MGADTTLTVSKHNLKTEPEPKFVFEIRGLSPVCASARYASHYGMEPSVFQQ